MPDLKVLLISTYEPGRQPFGLASPAARLRAAGFHATSTTSRDRRWTKRRSAPPTCAFYLPMHTATRIAVHALERVAPSARPTRTAADHHPPI
jgi:hypothetical protein